MNKELSKVFNSIAFVAIAVLAISWVYSILDSIGIDKIGSYEIRFGFFAAESALLSAVFILISLHCKNRFKLGDKDFQYPHKTFKALSLIAIYDFLEAIFQLGDDISLLKVIVVGSIAVYITIATLKERKRNGAI